MTDKHEKAIQEIEAIGKVERKKHISWGLETIIKKGLIGDYTVLRVHWRYDNQKGYIDVNEKEIFNNPGKMEETFELIKSQLRVEGGV